MHNLPAENLKVSVFFSLIIVAVICSIMSQLPIFVLEEEDSYLKYTWLLPFGYSLFYLRSYFSKNIIPFYFFIFCFSFYCFTLETLNINKKYFGSDFYNIILSIVIFSISFVFWKNLNEKYKRQFKIILGCLLLITIVLYSYQIYIYSFIGEDIFTDRYLYLAKNSAGQIILAGLLAGAYLSWPKFSVLRIIYLIVILFGLFMVFIIKSRATLCGLLFILFYFSFGIPNKTFKHIYWVLIIFAAIYLFIFSNYGEFTYKAFFLRGREYTDLNDLSSGRLIIIDRKFYFENIIEFFLGVGNVYLDCFPLAILLQYGLCGSLIIFSFLLYIGKKITLLSKKDSLYIITKILFWIYMINSLFEAQTPFGPGAKCFILWMFIGFAFANKNDELDNKRMLICRGSI